jgi:hypothetical protein
MRHHIGLNCIFTEPKRTSNPTRGACGPCRPALKTIGSRALRRNPRFCDGRHIAIVGRRIFCPSFREPDALSGTPTSDSPSRSDLSGGGHARSRNDRGNRIHHPRNGHDLPAAITHGAVQVPLSGAKSGARPTRSILFPCPWVKPPSAGASRSFDAFPRKRTFEVDLEKPAPRLIP